MGLPLTEPKIIDITSIMRTLRKKLSASRRLTLGVTHDRQGTLGDIREVKADAPRLWNGCRVHLPEDQWWLHYGRDTEIPAGNRIASFKDGPLNPEGPLGKENRTRYGWKKKKSKNHRAGGEAFSSYPARDRFHGGIGADHDRTGRGKNPVPHPSEREQCHEADETE
jgi:hypothetical protein